LTLEDDMKTRMLAVLCLVCACGAAPDPADDPKCQGDAKEEDFMPQPRMGAPVEGTQYIISSTYLRLRPGDEVKMKFQKLGGAVIASLEQTDGFISAEFAS